jgi:hypothetical protein
MVLEILQHLIDLLGPLNLSWRLSNLKKGGSRSPSREMNLLKAAMQPVSFWTSLIVCGASMAVMAVIFSGFASTSVTNNKTE